MREAYRPAAFLAASTLLACAALGCASILGANFDDLHQFVSLDGSPTDDAPSDALSPDDVEDPDADPDAVTPDSALDGTPDRKETSPKVKVVFVSSALFDGNLGGLAGADEKCRSLATNAGLAGTFGAWLSTDTADADSQLTHAIVPYALVNGTIVASNWTQLVSGTLAHAIDLTEKGGPPPSTVQCGTSSTWTGTDSAGHTLPGQNCSAWSTNGITSAAVGAVGYVNSDWTQGCSTSCATQNALYCLEQ